MAVRARTLTMDTPYQAPTPKDVQEKSPFEIALVEFRKFYVQETEKQLRDMCFSQVELGDGATLGSIFATDSHRLQHTGHQGHLKGSISTNEEVA